MEVFEQEINKKYDLEDRIIKFVNLSDDEVPSFVCPDKNDIKKSIKNIKNSKRVIRRACIIAGIPTTIVLLHLLSGGYFDVIVYALLAAFDATAIITTMYQSSIIKEERSNIIMAFENVEKSFDTQGLTKSHTLAITKMIKAEYDNDKKAVRVFAYDENGTKIPLHNLNGVTYQTTNEVYDMLDMREKYLDYEVDDKSITKLIVAGLLKDDALPAKPLPKIEDKIVTKSNHNYVPHGNHTRYKREEDLDEEQKVSRSRR